MSNNKHKWFIADITEDKKTQTYDILSSDFNKNDSLDVR